MRLMAGNPILDEIHAAREKLLADCNWDLHAYILGARERALASGHPIAALKPREIKDVKSTAQLPTDLLETGFDEQ